VHKICFLPGLRSGPHWGSLERSPDLLAGLRALILKAEERKKGKEEGKRRGKEGRHRPSFRKFLDPFLY